MFYIMIETKSDKGEWLLIDNFNTDKAGVQTVFNHVMSKDLGLDTRITYGAVTPGFAVLMGDDVQMSLDANF